jgi:hypothetical protein
MPDKREHHISYFILGLALLGLIWLPLSSSLINQSPMLVSFTSNPDKFQIYGQPVYFLANAEDANNDQVFYRFLVDEDPKREWAKCNSWVWDISEANRTNPKGNYKITVEIKDREYDKVADDFRDINYTLASIEIVYPKDNDTVTKNQTVNGTSKGIGKNQRGMFWIFVKGLRTGYHPQDKIDIYIDSKGNWTTEFDAIAESGHRSEIVVALLNETALHSIAEYYEVNKRIEYENNKTKNESDKQWVWPGFMKLPIGAQEMDYVRVRVK